MSPSPFRSRLYRRLGQAVICVALAVLVAQNGFGQVARKEKVKGPRATALIELAANGKAHLIPITIMVDGRFYDASAYKANPVPFALESEVVYRAMRSGVPQGEFTVTGALQAQNTWFGEGKWVAGGSKPKTHAAEAKPNLDDDSGPPTLRKAGSKGSKPPESAPAPSSTPAPAPTPSSGGHGSSDSQTSESSPTPAAKPPAEDSSESANDEDPNRPSLRRGKATSAGPTPSSSSNGASKGSPVAGAAAHSGSKPKEPDKVTGPIQLLPAVSDAGGPEPRPYMFDMKSEEEESYRKKLMVLATAEVLSKAKQMTPVMPSAAPPKKTPAKPAAKTAQPVFDSIQFRAFDLSNTNEPVFVLSAQAHVPASSASQTGPATYFITLVAKADIYLDLHRLLAQVTDEHHLDEFPRFELIDAVDADGDGRGELLFREISDQGTAWAVYRAAADRLYPLFEGKPQQAHPLPVSER